MRTEFLIDHPTRNDCTPDETWNAVRDPSHHYFLQADFALSRLGAGPGECLVIGSPLFEALELGQAGWRVTYVDVRTPPMGFPAVVQGDAALLKFQPEFFDSASSGCVLCHAGMGRYGEPVVEDSDVKILQNIYRALKPGAKAAITFGPVAAISMVARDGNRHRIYNLPIAREMAGEAGFSILEEAILDISMLKWIDKPDGVSMGKNYLSMLLRKAS